MNPQTLQKFYTYFPEHLFKKTQVSKTVLDTTMLKKAFQNQLDKKPGVSFIEIVSNCNSGWKMTPTDSNVWMEENMFPFYELGDIKVDGKLVEKK